MRLIFEQEVQHTNDLVGYTGSNFSKNLEDCKLIISYYFFWIKQ